MRLERSALPRPELPVIPLASLAMLVLTLVVISAMYSASRGPGLRFASVDRDGSFNLAAAVRVEVLSDQEILVDGTPVPFPLMVAALTDRLTGRRDAAVILVISPDATYETMVAAYGAIESLPGRPKIAFPARGRGIRG